MLLAFPGPVALSEFRRLSLLDRCRERVPTLMDLHACYFYVALAERQLTLDEEVRLRNVLGVPSTTTKLDGKETLLVCPRPGTISPWSSKASDILQNCGVDGILRVERGIAYTLRPAVLSSIGGESLLPFIHDRMTEAIVEDPLQLFRTVEPRSLCRIPLQARRRTALEQENVAMGLALSEEEMDYFCRIFTELGRDPSDVELMMFAVVNSEHCRHKIFNAEWEIDGVAQANSLFDMIRHTHDCHPEGCVTAYSDNAGVIRGFESALFRPVAEHGHQYAYRQHLAHVLMKVETHNHPTAISPHPGASTGVGGEIRDEGATGTGGQFQAGLSGFLTSHLRIPGFDQPWEHDFGESPTRLATPLEIMTEGPIGGAAFGNEFGRPNIVGVFRTFEEFQGGRWRGFHKPIMIAGGVGLIDAECVEKKKPRMGDYVIQLGGPSMLIGLGGGSASSMKLGSNLADLDFASVQRDNPEMQRRCQELINRCAADKNNPILSIHDVGAGGLSNACPELVENTGAIFNLRAIPSDDSGMSPMEIWCNEAQERYVLIIGRDDLERFTAVARRERCLFAVIGEISGDGKLHLKDDLLAEVPIDGLQLDNLLGKPPRMRRQVKQEPTDLVALSLDHISLTEAVRRILRFPAVASKKFLITISDRTVTGLVARDQMVGPYQVPVADLALTAHSYNGYTGSAMAMGERAPVALIDAPASGRLAVAEAVTNIAAAHIGSIHNIKLSGNWMCACGEDGEDAKLYDTVAAVALSFCPELGISIPVGKDSLSMRAVWEDGTGQSQTVISPLSLVASAFAPVVDIRRHVTPQLVAGVDSRLLLLDLGFGANRLGGSALAQVDRQIGDRSPDVAACDLRRLYDSVQELLAENLVLSYHDRSDGGLFVTIVEMAFAGRCGVRLDVAALGSNDLAVLFAEEVGVVLQYAAGDDARIQEILIRHGLGKCAHVIGAPTVAAEIDIRRRDKQVFCEPVVELQKTWSETTFHMQALRDHPDCAVEEFTAIGDLDDPGLNFRLSYEMSASMPNLDIGAASPCVAVLREQGINGHVEMAAAFDRAGFASVDVTMTDLIEGRTDLGKFQGLAVAGGFSYGDVLGAGAGWARSILHNFRLRDMFAAFFACPETFTLGVCNGCQMLSYLRELIPGAELWPQFVRNRSEQFEARLVTVEVLPGKSVLLRDMVGSCLPVAVAHGEGCVECATATDLEGVVEGGQACLRYVDNRGHPTESYPYNPNGSPGGITALCSADGRATIMMPHPERLFRSVQLSYRPPTWTDESGPWLKLFQNAYAFVRQS